MLIKNLVVSDKEIEKVREFFLEDGFCLRSITVVDVVKVHVIHGLMPKSKAFRDLILFLFEVLCCLVSGVTFHLSVKV